MEKMGFEGRLTHNGKSKRKLKWKAGFSGVSRDGTIKLPL